MLLTDKTLECQDCGAEFAFTVGEQEFYKEKGFKNEPKRCPECRRKRKRERYGGRERKMHTIVCAECGTEAQVPFEPRQGRPVYCRECYENQRQ